MSGASNLHTAWARLFLRAAAASGVRDVVVSPGSRSTPLALAAAENAELRSHVIVDERSAGFFALGQARASGIPSLLICTSGTAGAHYLPAVIEASQSFVPLIVVTADRPWELQGAAAPQTIDQLKLFGSYVRHFADVGLPDPSPIALRAAARAAAQAALRASSPEPGPVHVNVRFRKPLEPVSLPAGAREAWEDAWEALMIAGPARTLPARMTPDPRAIEVLVDRCSRAERGLVICGPSITGASASAGASDRGSSALRGAVASLARASGFPVLAEATSQIRFGDLGPGVVVASSFDVLLRDRAFRAAHEPDLLIEIGAPPTSQGYAELLAERRGCPRFVVAPYGWNDPDSGASALLFGDPAELCSAVARRLVEERRSRRRGWAESFARADARAWSIIDREIKGDRLSEGAVARSVVDACPEGSLLIIGNSSPVRDLDLYCAACPRVIRVLHQRGASGIDGLVSGAAGARSASNEPVTLLLGDLSLLHDLTGLGVARGSGGPLVIVVVQNGGGRIFERLPIGRAAAVAGSARGPRADLLGAFERFFTTPQRVDFEHAAATFGVTYARVSTTSSLASALHEARARADVTLIEAVVPPSDGAARAGRIAAALSEELGDLAKRSGAAGHRPDLSERNAS